jgi:hypothetical protein
MEIRDALHKFPVPWLYELRQGTFARLKKPQQREFNITAKKYRLMTSPRAGQRLAAWKGLWKAAYVDKSKLFDSSDSSHRGDVFGSPNDPPAETTAQEMIWAWMSAESARDSLIVFPKDALAPEWRNVLQKKDFVERLTVMIMPQILKVVHGPEWMKPDLTCKLSRGDFSQTLQSYTTWIIGCIIKNIGHRISNGDDLITLMRQEETMRQLVEAAVNEYKVDSAAGRMLSQLA